MAINTTAEVQGVARRDGSDIIELHSAVVRHRNAAHEGKKRSDSASLRATPDLAT